MNSLKEQDLHELVRNFNVIARPTGPASNPATIEDIDNLVTQTAYVLDQIIAYMCQN